MKKIFTIYLTIHSIFLCANDSTKAIVYFDFNDYNLSEVSKVEIRKYIDIDTSKFIIERIEIIGHSDQIGSTNFNDLLSIKRALSVSSFIRTHINNYTINITTKGYGESQLINTKVDDESRKVNRRAEIKIIYSEKIVITTNVETQKEETQKEEKITIQPIPNLQSQITDTTTKIGDKIILRDILFYGGRHDFLAISYATLEDLFNTMKQIQTLEIEIHGHICCAPGIEDGTDLATGRKNLSVERAKAVFNYLKYNGINPTRMSYKGFGHEFPLTQERNSYEEARNRRVEIKIIKK